MLDPGSLVGAPLNRLAQELAAVLRDLITDGAHFIVINVDPKERYYVQAKPTDGGGLYCEAVSNNFLSGEERLGPDAEEEMLSLGWASPDPNFRQLWEHPVPVHIVAERIVSTMTTVYGLSDTASLAVRSGLLSNGAIVSPPMRSPLADGHEVLIRCTWLYDYNDDWGGFVAGELLLRDDGKLYTRKVTSLTGEQGTEYTMSEWEPEPAWTGGAEVDACLTWMRRRNYQLYEPFPVRIDATHAGPFPGLPPEMRPLSR